MRWSDKGGSVVECESDLRKRVTFYSQGDESRVVHGAANAVNGSPWKERSGGVGKYVGRIQISVGRGPRGPTERERRRKSRKGFSERVSKRHQRQEAAPFPPVEYKSNTCECIARCCFVLRKDQCERDETSFRQSKASSPLLRPVQIINEFIQFQTVVFSRYNLIHRDAMWDCTFLIHNLITFLNLLIKFLLY